MKVNANRSALEHNYSRIDFVTPDSVLNTFLCRKLPETNPHKNKVITNKIYPFGFNGSQKEAVDKALANKLSIIEGPPGTGKTQTILNIIANTIIQNDSVAVVSSNNSATKNILDKLQSYNTDFVVAYLGKNANKEDFINSQKPLPDMTDWKLTPNDMASLLEKLKSRYRELEKKLVQKNELSTLKQELSVVKTEEKHFIDYFNSVENFMEPQVLPEIGTSEKALEMWLSCETYKEKSGWLVTFVRYVLDYLRFWNRNSLLVRKLFNQYSRDLLVAIFQRRFYELKILELKKSISILVDELNLFNFDTKMSEYTEISAQIFRAKLAKKYDEKKRKLYELDDLRKNSKDFIKDYPVILSTTYSLRSSLSNDVMYDYVIFDESSQVDLCTGGLALSCARKAVIVGDLKQLPNVVDSRTSKITDAVFAKYDLPEVYRYKNHSLLSAITEMFPEAPNTFLREHYRCHPKIIEFCNKKFYDGQIIVLTEPKSNRDPLFVYKTPEGNHERNRINQRQIDIIKGEIIPQQQLSATDGSLGIVTPYRNQTHALKNAFEETKIKADTVDKFQGQENKIVILSTVDNEISKFTDNANRLNVAVSRAIDQLIVVVSDNDTKKDTNIGDLVRYIEYNEFKIIESKVYSVFDYLYKSYSERRKVFLAKYKRVSEYNSENLMFALITDILKDEKFKCFEVAVHVPFKMIIRDISLMTSPEKEYAMNSWTHVDFLIFDAIGKIPKLVIEVDGVALHAEGTKQHERDKLKDKILKKYDLPILRLKTDGSRERERLVEALDAIVNGPPTIWKEES